MARKYCNKTIHSHNKNQRKIQELETAIQNNYSAMSEPVQRKHWTEHDITHLHPLTQAQEDFFRAYYESDWVVSYGSAGTGKTLLALYLSILDVLDKQQPYNKIIIVRSVVPSREMGHLPGTIEEKQSVYEAPYIDVMSFLCSRSSTYNDMKDAGLIKFESTSFIRGMTFDNSIVIIDEAQNLNFQEINTVVTRLGKTSKLLVLGDIRQNDLLYKKNDISGFASFIKISEEMKEASLVQFTVNDVVRSGLVKSWILTCDKLGY